MIETFAKSFLDLDLNNSLWIFQGFSLFSYQCSLLFCDNSYSITLIYIFVNNFLKLFIKTFSSRSHKKNGEGGIWTLAPVSRPIPLAGAPLRPLEYFSKGIYKYLLMLRTWRIVYSTKRNLFCQSKNLNFFIYFSIIFFITRYSTSTYYKAQISLFIL